MFQGVSYVYESDIRIQGHLAELVDNQALLMYISTMIEARDGYAYYLKNIGNPALRSEITFQYVCCQDASIQHQVPDAERGRLHPRMTTHDCGGSISRYINRNRGYIYLKISHHRNHPPPRHQEHIRTAMPPTVHDYIVQHAEDFDPKPMYRRLVNRFPEACQVVTQAQVSKRTSYDVDTMILF